MTKFKIGDRFGELTIVERASNAKWGGSRVYCNCSCGRTDILIEAHQLQRSSHAKRHCGCMRVLKHGHACSKNKSCTYQIWGTLLNRCGNPANKVYVNIQVCERWKSFVNFLSDMGEQPFPRATLERLDNREGYYPGNVKWATYHEQSRNRSNNVYVQWNDKRLCIADWASFLSIDRSTMSRRLRKWGVCELTFTSGAIKTTIGNCGRFQKAITPSIS